MKTLTLKRIRELDVLCFGEAFFTILRHSLLSTIGHDDNKRDIREFAESLGIEAAEISSYCWLQVWIKQWSMDVVLLPSISTVAQQLRLSLEDQEVFDDYLFGRAEVLRDLIQSSELIEVEICLWQDDTREQLDEEDLLEEGGRRGLAND